MQPYNVEIFDRNFNLIQHSNVGTLEYKYDYLSIVENSVLIEFNENVEKGNYIHLINDVDDYFGVICAIQVNEKQQGYSEIKYRPFISLFDSQIIFDTDLQGSSTTLERAIGDIITSYWINNSDIEQNIPGLTVQTISDTSSWGFHIASDVKELHYTNINFMETIIKRSLTKYRVGLYAIPNYTAKTIVLQIGVKSLDTTFNIEADLPSVMEKSVIINENSEDVNKLYVYDQTDMQTNVIYYKHTDGTYDTSDTDRIVPVIYEIGSVLPSEEEPFSEMAQDFADRTFDTESYNNLIEITIKNDDTLVAPDHLTIGQIVNVITNGSSYASILTGIERGERTKLIYGTIRLELTKILRRQRNG
jgi:hypothetical protein